MSEQRLREDVSAASRLLWERGWVANHDGNVTARLDDGRILATPTAVSKRLISPDHVILLGPDGKLLDGQRIPGRPFSEIHLHLRAYAARPDAKCVLHAHPPTASGFSVSGLPVDARVLAEAVVSLGPGAPVVPYGRPGSKDLEESMAKALVEADAVLLGNHGPLTIGADVEQAFLRMELVEHLAKIQLVARQIGRVNTLPADEVAHLLEKRTAAGLGPAARGVAVDPKPPEPEPVVVGLKPLPPAPAAFPDPSVLERLVREELARLRG